MRSVINGALHVVGVIGAMVFVGAVSLGLSYVGPRTETVAGGTTQGMVSPLATLDTSQIDDLRGQGYILTPDTGEVILVPGGAILETTPMVPVPSTAYVVPEESPDGGYPLGRSAWLDNSPLYSDGWVLLVNDSDHTITWRAPAEECTTDLDCVTEMPHVIPDAHTARAYWSTWDVPHFPTTGDCTAVDWHHGAENGGPIVPADRNDDGVIDCGSDLELGA